MLDQTFVFYYKVNGKPVQTYSMVKYSDNEHIFEFNDSIGGFAFGLRTNKSFAKSTWPGVGSNYDNSKYI